MVRVQAAVDGQGVMLADGLVDAELASGELITPFNISLEGYGYHLLWDDNVTLNPITESFLDWIMTQT